MQGLLDAQLVRHRRPDGRVFRIEPKVAGVLEKLVELFRMAGWEEEVEDIMEAWTQVTGCTGWCAEHIAAEHGDARLQSEHRELFQMI